MTTERDTKFRQKAAPSGYVMVPVDPTPGMIKAFAVALEAATQEEWASPAVAGEVQDLLENFPSPYHALLAAAPQAAEPASQSEIVKAIVDAVVTGHSFILFGKRVAPEEVYAHPEPPEPSCEPNPIYAYADSYRGMASKGDRRLVCHPRSGNEPRPSF